MLAALVGGALATPVAAQVNVERLRGEAEPGLSGAVGSNLTLKAGNVDLLTVDGGAAMRYQEDIHSLLLDTSAKYGREAGERFDAGAFGHLRWTAMWWTTVGTELFTQLQYDEFVRLNLRVLGGGGLRVLLLQTELWTLYAGTGYMLEHEKLDIPATDSHPQSTLAHRSTSYLSVTLALRPFLHLVQTAYAQPRFDRPKDVRILDELSLELSVFEWFQLTMSFGLRYDSDPPDTVEKLDVQLKNGFKLAF
jgi:hypothetical protein